MWWFKKMIEQITTIYYSIIIATLSITKHKTFIKFVGEYLHFIIISSAPSKYRSNNCTAVFICSRIIIISIVKTCTMKTFNEKNNLSILRKKPQHFERFNWVPAVKYILKYYSYVLDMKFWHSMRFIAPE